MWSTRGGAVPRLMALSPRGVLEFTALAASRGRCNRPRVGLRSVAWYARGALCVGRASFFTFYSCDMGLAFPATALILALALRPLLAEYNANMVPPGRSAELPATIG